MLLENVISSYALEQLPKRARGYVQSVFATSFNVELEGFLFHVGSSQSPLSCCGINLAPDALNALRACVRVGDQAGIKGGVLYVYDVAGVARLDISPLEVRSLSVASPVAAEHLATLERELEGLALEGRIGLVQDARFRQAMQALAQHEPSEEGIRAAIGFLLGRGLGLTPSGDDLLVGYGISLWLQGRARKFVQVLDGLPRGRTTKVSESYLQAMAAGYANQGYCELSEAVATGACERFEGLLADLQRVGHTSGSDGLFGFLVGLRSGMHE